MNQNHRSSVGHEKSLLAKEEIVDRMTATDDRKKITITPILSSKQIQQASVDLRIGPNFAIIKIGKMTHLDPLRNPDDVEREVKKYTDKYKIFGRHERFILHPNEFVLATTLEYIRLPNDIAGRLEGRSSWGRLGILVHITAGYIDPGYRGIITFELKNAGKIPIPIYPGTRIAQLSFFHIENSLGYSGRYQDSLDIINSRFFLDEEFNIKRNMYAEEYYKNKVTDIFESVENNKGLPRASSPEKFPQELIDAIAEIYKRRIDKKDYLSLLRDIE